MIIIKELGRQGREYIWGWGDGSSDHSLKAELETLRWCYGRHRADRWIEVWICEKMSRIKIENWIEVIRNWNHERKWDHSGRVHSMRTVGRGWTSWEYHNLRDELRKKSLENKSHYVGPWFLSWWDSMTSITLSSFPGHAEPLENHFLVFGSSFSMSNDIK